MDDIGYFSEHEMPKWFPPILLVTNCRVACPFKAEKPKSQDMQNLLPIVGCVLCENDLYENFEL